MKRRDIASAAAKLLAAAAAGVSAIAAQDASENPAPDKKREKKLVEGEAEAKRMLLLMDKDKNGKISRQEFMSFMEEEFDRLDVNKDGELDVRELTQTRLRIGGAVHR